MKVRELIDFYLAIRPAGQLLGFGAVFEGDLNALKEAIRQHYGSQDAWLALPEDTDLPDEIARMAQDLLKKFDVWNRKKSDG